MNRLGTYTPGLQLPSKRATKALPNQIETSTISVQFVPAMPLFAFDFAASAGYLQTGSAHVEARNSTATFFSIMRENAPDQMLPTC
eukprot:1385511-Rhodomonas_salina.4